MDSINKIRKVFKSPKISFIVLGIVSTLWFFIRVIPKPQRATYPCMKATAPIASAFVIYLLGLSASVFSLKKFREYIAKSKIKYAFAFLLTAIVVSFLIIPLNQNTSYSNQAEVSLEDPNSPMGEAKGINPGRVVWVFDRDATNNECTNTWEDGYFLDKNTNQSVVDDMLDRALLSLTNESTISNAWNAVFNYYNQQKGKGSVGYSNDEVIFIKINATSTWSENINTSDFLRVNNDNYAIAETSPQLVTSVLRGLVDVVGVPQNKIYVGDPLKHIYEDNYTKWHTEFPDVHYLDYSYNTNGREVVQTSDAIIDYSDRGAVLRTGSWSDATVGDPIYTDNLYSIFKEMEYMINIPTMKGHKYAGVTMFAKNHFGSHTRSDAKHLHGGLTNVGPSLRNSYGMYRVLVDIMGHELLGEKNLIYLMDALYTSEQEVNQPDKWQKPPWNSDWTSSIFVSQDPVAIESVGFDFLFYEFDGTNGLDDFPHFGAVDDYLHQAADKSNWPDEIIYDPENDGSELSSLGVHEHWNNSTDKQYSRNLQMGNGIELVQIIAGSNNIDEKGLPKGSGLTLSLYPIPAMNELNLKMENTYTGPIRVEVFDINGKKIMKKNHHKSSQELHDIINVGRFENGIYFLKLRYDSKQEVCKFQIRR